MVFWSPEAAQVLGSRTRLLDGNTLSDAASLSRVPCGGGGSANPPQLCTE